MSSFNAVPRNEPVGIRGISVGGSELVLATDVNRCNGTFTGCDEVWSLVDLMHPVRQELVIRSSLRYNFQRIAKGLSEAGIVNPKALGQERLILGEKIECTLSGLLAAAHLCGPSAVLDLVPAGKLSEDETRTSILQYMSRFSGLSVESDLVA